MVIIGYLELHRANQHRDSAQDSGYFISYDSLIAPAYRSQIHLANTASSKLRDRPIATQASEKAPSPRTSNGFLPLASAKRPHNGEETASVMMSADSISPAYRAAFPLAPVWSKLATIWLTNGMLRRISPVARRGVIEDKGRWRKIGVGEKMGEGATPSTTHMKQMTLDSETFAMQRIIVWDLGNLDSDVAVDIAGQGLSSYRAPSIFAFLFSPPSVDPL
jgi:hypothetical protein